MQARRCPTGGEERMIEHPDNETASRRIAMAATVIVSVAAVVVILRGDRAYQRWLAGISPFARPRAGLTRYRTDLRRRRSAVTEFGRLINDVLDQVAEGIAASASK
jgi:hypothetical protein